MRNLQCRCTYNNSDRVIGESTVRDFNLEPVDNGMNSKEFKDEHHNICCASIENKRNSIFNID